MNEKLLSELSKCLPRGGKRKIAEITGRKYEDVRSVLRGNYIRWDVIVAATFIIEEHASPGGKNIYNFIEEYTKRNIKIWQ